MRALALFLVAACVHAPMTPTTWPEIDAQLLADSAETLNFRLGLPAALAITPDGAVLFRRTPPRSFAADLYELDTKTGAVKVLVSANDLLGTGDEHLSDAEKARRERTRTATRGVVDIDVSADGKTVMIPLAGKLYLVDRSSGERTVLDPGGEAYDPHMAPDGQRVVFVRGGDLWLIGRSGPARQLTKHPEGFEYGVADFAAMEELDRRRGFWWSPDSKRLLVQRTDNRPIDTIYVADARHNDKPPVPFKYPRAGTKNAIVDIGVMDASGGELKWLKLPPELEYIARVSWSKDGPATVLALPREQERLELFKLDGDTWKPILEESAPTWVNVPRPAGTGHHSGTPLWLDGGKQLLWMDEIPHGAWTLSLRDGDGHVVRELTAPEFGLRAIVGIDGADVLVEASADPTRLDVWRVPLAGGAPTRVTPGDGIYGASFDYGVLLVGASLHAGGKKFYAVANGKTFELPSVAERPKLIPTTRLETVQVGGRTHHTTITRPRNFDPNKKYPVILQVYAGPHAQVVNDALDGYVMSQWYADAGFVVVSSDGRGTPNRGVAWERAIYKDLITVPLEDQIGALQAMGARHPEMDMSRVGVTGWSFGGYFSTMAVLLRPDVFQCGVAGAPVTDWKLYDTAYTERYMRMPEHNPEGYKATSALTYADKLSRPLLIIHGITDDNVHFAHTLALIEALYVAGKYANVITLSATHMVPDPKLSLAREKVQIDFFRSHLGPP